MPPVRATMFAAAGNTGKALMLGLIHDALARQMIRERSTGWDGQRGNRRRANGGSICGLTRLCRGDGSLRR